MEWLETTYKIMEIVAILGGGSWAYFQFFKGRTLKRRMNVSLRAQIVERQSRRYVLASLCATNVGMREIDLDVEVCRGFLLMDKATGPATDWIPLARFQILGNQVRMEPNEKVDEEILIPIPGTPRSALKVEVFIGSKARQNLKDTTKNAAWSASAVVTPSAGEGGGHGSDDSRHSKEGD
jgi:hypothetical protein